MEPYLFDQPIWGKVDLYNQTQQYDGYELRTNGVGLSAGKSFGEYVTTSLRYGLDNTLVSDITITAPLNLQRQLDNYGDRINTSELTWSLARDSRDYYLDPKTGSKNSIYVEYAGGPLGGDTNIIKTGADSAWYFPLVWDAVFMVRGRYGYVESLINKPVPVGDLFYVGGSSTVRGFRFGSAGPKDTSLDALGGTKEMIYNAEINFPIVPSARLKGVLFYDTGKGFDIYEPVSIAGLHQAAGFGFQWISPIGPLKFEWAYIIHKLPTDQPSQFDFSMGALF
jgi:outer membrane protein insertion porin family